MSTRTVKVSNISLSANEKDIKEFFSFSGDIEYVEMRSWDEWSQIAYITFEDSQAIETALLLSGATIVDQSVMITHATDYQLPHAASAPTMGATIVDQSVMITHATDYQLPHAASAPTMAGDVKAAGGAESAVRKAEDVVSSVLAKGFVLGKGAFGKAKTFDEKHQLTSTAATKVALLDRKIGLSQKIGTSTSAVGSKVKEVDQKFQVSDKTKSAFAAAGQQAGNVGSTVLKNKYVGAGASWVSGAFGKVAKVAGDVGSKTKEKVAAKQGN